MLYKPLYSINRSEIWGKYIKKTWVIMVRVRYSNHFSDPNYQFMTHQPPLSSRNENVAIALYS